jgi:hypothetical protein
MRYKVSDLVVGYVQLQCVITIMIFPANTDNNDSARGALNSTPF